MSDTKISALAALGGAPATGDKFVLVDVSDTSMAASGTTKYVLRSDLDALWLPQSYLDTDTALAANSDTKVASQKATKAYADGKAAKASNLSDLANASTARTNLGVAIGSDVQAHDGDLDSISALNTLAFGRGLLEMGNASATRTNLGLVIGTDVQAHDGELDALAGLTSAADKVPYFTGSGAAALADLTSYGRTITGVANQAALTALIAAATTSLSGAMSAADKTKLDTFAAAFASGRISGSNFTRTTASLADITGMSFAVAASEVWAFVAFLMTQSTSGSAAGNKFGVNITGTGSPTIEAGIFGSTTAQTAFTTRRITALNTASAAFDTVTTTPAMKIMMGLATAGSGAGTFSIQGQPTTGGDTFTGFIGSFVLGWKLA